MGGEVKSMRSLYGLVCIGLVIAACGPARGGPQGTGDKLYEATAQSILVIDSRNHSIERHLPLGAPSSDWKHLYSVVGDSLVDTNPLTGVTQNALPVGAGYQLPLATHSGLPGGLSPAGRWLVMQAGDSSATRMVVIDTVTFKVTDRFDMNGRFNFDAISDDGQRLYLIQYLNGKEYYVRLFDIPSNSLDANIVVDKSDGNQAMAGLRLSGIATPDGGSLFSMYVRENESPFIHALSLQGPFAFCLDLPGAGYARDKEAMQWGLAMNRDGSRVYAINGASGTVAEVDANQMQVVRTAQISTGSSGATGADTAVLSPDGRTLVTASSSGIVWVDTSSLQVRLQALSEWHAWSLSLSSDGKTLFVVNDAGAVAAVSMASGEVTGRFDPGTGRPIALMRVASS
jgi:hypothetical protein